MHLLVGVLDTQDDHSGLIKVIGSKLLEILEALDVEKSGTDGVVDDVGLSQTQIHVGTGVSQNGGKEGTAGDQLQVDGEYAMTPVFSDINGYVYWEGSGYVYYTQTYGWVYCNKFPGYEPFEDYEYNYEDKEYIWKGDEFYTFSSPPYGPDNEVKMEPRGSIHKSGKEKTLKAVWPRWVAKNGEFGVYEGKDGESGQRIKGLPRFKGNGE